MSVDKYYVRKRIDENGDYEVHNSTCSWLPKLAHREFLGQYESCDIALDKAEAKGYEPANGCEHCLESCHTS